MTTGKESLHDISFVDESALQDYFLAELGRVGFIPIAEERTGLKGYNKRWAKDDPSYAARVKDAEDSFRGVIIAEMIRRGVVGNRRKKFHKDEPIIDPETGEQYVEYEQSDRLLLALAAAHDERFRTSRQEVEHSGVVGCEVSGQLKLGVRVLESDDWYGTGNKAATNRQPSASDGSPAGSGALTGPVQGDCVRTPVGQDGDWIDDDPSGPRLIQGPETGGD